MCTIKGIWPSIKDSSEKKLYTMLFDVKVWRLATVVEGEHWIINSDTVYHNANHDNLWPKKAKFPYNKRPERVTQLGKFRAESGVNFELPPFPCPSVDKPPFGRMAVEFSCENCMVSYNHTFWDPMMGKLYLLETRSIADGHSQVSTLYSSRVLGRAPVCIKN
jgi:hypothetical protein